MPRKSDLPHNTRILRLDPHSAYRANSEWEETPMRGFPETNIRYGRWTEDSDEGTWFLCDALSYSDYSGTKPTFESNVRVFSENYACGEGKWWVRAIGGHDTTAILIRTLAYRNCEEIRELIDGLSDYPVIDDSDMSELEMDREQEGWEDYGCDDFKRALVSYLEKRFSDRGVTCDDSGKDADTIVDALTDAQVWALYMQRCQDTNINGGATCLWEGESHPHFFCNEMAFGHDASYREEFGRDPWDGLVPMLDASGKVSYHAGEIAGWIPVCDWKPSCPRCGKVQDQSATVLIATASLWDAPCDDLGCDVPEANASADPTLFKLAAFILRSWDVGMQKPYNHLFECNPSNVGDAFDRLATACETKGDTYAAVALHFHDPEDPMRLMLAGKTRRVVRGVLREIVRGEAPKPRDCKRYPYEAGKPVCCLVYGSSCCAHREKSEWDRKRTWCVRSNVRGSCTICGHTREER